jgi:hypothetical protein
MPQHDERDHLAALDFSGVDESYDDGSEEFDALDFSAADDDGSEEAAIDALDEYAPAEPEEAGTELDAIDAQADAVEGGKADEEDGLQLFTVTNPPDTVSVSALIDGRTQRIELSAKVTSMSEAELADEILVLADLARLKGLAAQHTYLLESASDPESMREMGEMGADTFEALRDFMENGMKLSTPEQAAAAQAEVFATRYATDK